MYFDFFFFAGVPKAVNLNQRIDLLYDLSEYVQRLLQAEDCVQIVKTEHQSKVNQSLYFILLSFIT